MPGQAIVTAVSARPAVAAPIITAPALVTVERAAQPVVTAAAGTDLVAIGLEQGLRGAPGADGQSAYQLAVAGGFVGTEQQWIASLAGGGSLVQRLASLAPQTAVVPVAPDLPFAADAPGLPLAAAALQPGFPLALDRDTDAAVHARADTYALCFVLGLAQAGIEPGGNVLATRLFLSLADWTTVAGSERLAVGRPYFLAPAGGLTLVPPAKPDSVCNVRIGEALTPRTLVFGPSTPILL